MPSYYPPKKNTEYIFYVSLRQQADTKLMQANPTIATGDFQVSTDGGALSDLDTLPTVSPASSEMVKVTLSATEMNGDNVTVLASDAAGAQWCDLTVNIQTAARQIDDLAYPTTSGRSIDVTTTGEVGLDYANTNGTIDASDIAADAIGSSQLAATAATEIRDAVTGGAYALDTDANGRIRIVDGTSAGELDTTSGKVDIGAINGDANAAARLALSAVQIIPGTVDTVVNTHTPTTTEFQADDITEATTSHYVGRIVIFTSGVLLGQATTISAYTQVGGIGQFTVGVMTDAPANNDTFIIV